MLRRKLIATCSLFAFNVRPSDCLARKFRYYSTKSDEEPDISQQDTASPPHRKNTGTDSEVDPTGMLLKSRPDVPLNWRSMENLSEWHRQRFALKEKFHGKGGWNPSKRVSRSAMESIRYLKAVSPNTSVSDIAAQYKMSPDAVRRILKSKWRPNDDEQNKISERWRRRGERINNLDKTKQSNTGDAKKKDPASGGPSKPKKKGKKKQSHDLGNMYF